MHDMKEGKKHYYKQLTTTSMASWITRKRSHKMASHTLFQTWQQGKMKLHEILSKFHVGHDQIGATVQQLRAKQEITTICQNQPHSIFYTPQLRATQLR